jgi:hypothetical protein
MNCPEGFFDVMICLHRTVFRMAVGVFDTEQKGLARNWCGPSLHVVGRNTVLGQFGGPVSDPRDPREAC